MSDRTVQGAIDYTDQPGETHIAEIDQQTVAGSSADDSGDETTQLWSEHLPRSVFSSAQQEAVEALLVTDDLETIAEKVGCSPSNVRKAGQTAAAICDPADTSLNIPDEWPTWSRESLDLDDGRIRDGAFESSHKRPTTEGEGTSDDTREILGRYVVNEQSVGAIAEAMGIRESQVTGALAARDVVPRDEWIIPDSDGSEAEADASASGQAPETTSDASAIADTADLGACACAVPSLAVDAAQLGPNMMQSLFCAACEHEFARLRGDGDE